MTSVLTSYFSPSASQKATVGDTKVSLVEVDHLGWLKCDGRELSVANFRRLYNAIGNTYGGNDTVFNLPNPAGRVVGISGAGAGLTNRPMGTEVGTETHTLTTLQMPAHTHTYGNESTTGVGGSGGSAASASETSTDTGSTGGGQPHNNMQPTLFVGNMFVYCGRTEQGTYTFFGAEGGMLSNIQ